MALRSLISRSPSSMASLSVLFSVRAFASKSVPCSLAGRPSHILRLRPLVSALWSPTGVALGGDGLRCFSTRPTTSSLNDPSPNWSNRPPKETILLDGCDFEHWLVVMEPPEGEPTRDEIIDSYIKTLAQIVGSEEEARQKIYSVSTKHYFAFGALVSEELSYKIKTLPRVRWVLPDSYLDVKNKDYGGEPFIDGKAVPYDPKYHEEWVRNNARANERSRRNDRPRNFDRSRNFERRRENMQSRDFQNRPPPEFQNREGQQNPMQGTPPPMPNRDAPPNPSFQGAPYQNQGPPYQGNYMPQMQSPEFQNREGQSPPPYTPGPPPQGGPYQNQGPGYQANYAPNNAPGGNAYQGGGNFYQRGGGPYQGGGNPQQGGGNTYQGGGGGGGGAYQVGGNGFQGGGGNGYPGPDSAYQASGGNSFQARDVPGRD